MIPLKHSLLSIKTAIISSSMVNTSAFSQILSKYSSPNGVRIKNPVDVEKKIETLLGHGPTALQIITDFDATLTRYHLDGKKCDSSYGIIANTPYLPEEYRKKALAIYEKYHPIEMDPTISIEEKIPHMVEWYELSHEYMMNTEPRVKKEFFKKMVQESQTFLRDNAKELVGRLYHHNIPLLVLSAGLGDIVEEVLENCGIKYPNVKVISNFMEFDGDGHITAFKKPLIHMFNKNEAALHDDNTQYFEDLHSRHNVILMGDSLGDANMEHGVANLECVLKIGFLNSKIEESMEQYMDVYDIVLVDDQSMDLVNLLIDHVLGANAEKTG